MAFGSFALIVMVVGYAVGAGLSLVARSERSARVMTALGAVVGCVGGLAAAATVLGAFFLALVAAVSLPAAIYGVTYMAEYEDRCSMRVFGLMFNAFLLGMSLVPCAANIFTFVLAWELMAVASYFLVIALAVLLAIHAGGLRVRRADTWGCGRISQTPRMEYTASAFAEPLRRVFAEVYQPTQDLSISVHPESRYFIQSITYTSHVVPWFEKAFYDPVTRGARALATQIRRLQAGSLHLYLLYVVRGARGSARLRVVVQMSRYVALFVQPLVALALAPALVGFIRWLKARLQGRRGAPVWQPYCEIQKLFGKEAVVSHTASWLFRATPFIVFGTSVIVASLVPLVIVPAGPLVVGDVFAAVYLLLLGTFFLALAGLDTGSPFGGMGASREMTVVALTEPTVALSIVALALNAGSTNFSQIVARTIVWRYRYCSARCNGASVRSVRRRRT